MLSTPAKKTQSMAELRLAMSSLGQKFGLSALTLATEDGLLLAAAGPSEHNETLAAISPLVLASMMGEGVRETLDWLRGNGLTVRVRNIRYGSQCLYICAAGGNERVGGPAVGSLVKSLKSFLGI